MGVMSYAGSKFSNLISLSLSTFVSFSLIAHASPRLDHAKATARKPVADTESYHVDFATVEFEEGSSVLTFRQKLRLMALIKSTGDLAPRKALTIAGWADRDAHTTSRSDTSKQEHALARKRMVVVSNYIQRFAAFKTQDMVDMVGRTLALEAPTIELQVKKYSDHGVEQLDHEFVEKRDAILDAAGGAKKVVVVIKDEAFAVSH